jgi:hypothetical protein
MRGLRLDPGALLSAVAKLTKFNDRRRFPNSPELAPSMQERTNLTRAVAELVQ